MADVAIRTVPNGRSFVVIDGHMKEIEGAVIRLGPSSTTAEVTFEVNELSYAGEGKVTSARACLETCRNLLEHLNRLGGLGLDVHQMIETVLADTAMEPVRK